MLSFEQFLLEQSPSGAGAVVRPLWYYWSCPRGAVMVGAVAVAVYVALEAVGAMGAIGLGPIYTEDTLKVVPHDAAILRVFVG